MTDIEKQIQEYVEKGLSGDMASVNSIEDRILRGKVKAAIVKAKRLGLKKESAGPKELDKQTSKDDIITKLVSEGLSGNMENINALDDKVLRAKVKSALIKAKRKPDEQSSKTKPENPNPKDDIITKLVNEGLSGKMDNIDALEDRVLRAKVKSALIKAKKQVGKNSKSTDGGDLKPDLDEDNPNVNFGHKIQKKFPDAIQCDINEEYIGIKPEHWFDVAQWLKSEPDASFDSLQCVTGMDIGDNKLDSRYNLHSMKLGHLIEIRVEVPIENPKIPSIEQIWRIGDWFERETYDMYGIKYEGHRDLRRMLLPEDWEGFPLRKDYQEQETYHGIIVKKIKEEVWE